MYDVMNSNDINKNHKVPYQGFARQDL